MNRIFYAGVVAAACIAAPATVAAQQPTQRQVDSLTAQLRALRARLDSIVAALGQRPAVAAPAPAAPPGDDLAALRAAAAAAVGRDTAQAADTASGRRFVGRERSQAQLNPEISVTGDVRAYGTTTGIQRDNFDPHEFEIGFQSALDPYSHTKIFVSLENGDVAIEEGYAYWTGLPGRVRLDLGKFRQQFGELNRWHLHAVPETEYPLVLTTYLGEDGLAGTGLSLYRAFGGLGTHELTAQVTRSASDAELFGDGGRPTYLVRLLNFWQLGRRPPLRAMYHEWTLRGELLALQKEVAGAGPTRIGGYASTTYKLNQRFIAGVRYDYVESSDFGVITRQVIPSLTMWQSEWVFLRAQYQWQRVANAPATNQLAFQAVWAIGPHKHETY